jgi:hypothetical protein
LVAAIFAFSAVIITIAPLIKPVPVMFILVPPAKGPESGEMLEIVGAGSGANNTSLEVPPLAMPPFAGAARTQTTLLTLQSRTVRNKIGMALRNQDPIDVINYTDRDCKPDGVTVPPLIRYSQFGM